jgi:hypothetical protein
MIAAGAITMIIGTIILASSTTLAQLLVGRIVTGIVSDPRCTTYESLTHGFRAMASIARTFLSINPSSVMQRLVEDLSVPKELSLSLDCALHTGWTME